MSPDRVRSRPSRRARLVVLAIAIAASAMVSGRPPAAAAPTPDEAFTIDVADREAVRRAYHRIYRASDDVPIDWTGDVAACDAGTVSDAHLDATETRTNWFRAMAGVPADVVFTDDNNAKAQATALMMSAEGNLSHFPDTDWACWTQLGRDGASANLTLGTVGPAAIDALMEDNLQLGHRRNMLNPAVTEMGGGSIPEHAAGRASEAQFIDFDPLAPQRPTRDGFIAWPPAGFVPYQTTYPLWHFAVPGADLSTATVTMARGGEPIGTTITSRDPWIWPGLVWLTDDVAEREPWPRPDGDDTITVTIAGAVVDGEIRTFTYDVTVFDPDVVEPAADAMSILGPTAPEVGRPAAFMAAPVPEATGYEWRTTTLAQVVLDEGAEEGLGDFSALVDTYSPVSVIDPFDGEASFRLTIGQLPRRVDGSSRQTLTYDRTIVPTDDTELIFRSRARRLDNVDAVVEVSTDGGGTWTTVFTETEVLAPYVERTVPLGDFAGQAVEFRFRAEHSGSGPFACCVFEGWYVDDISLTDAFAGQTEVFELSPYPSVILTPAGDAAFDLDVRPHFFGSGPGEWSPAVRVTPVMSLTEAVDLTDGVVDVAGNQAWVGQAEVAHDGVDAARSGPVTHTERSVLRLDVEGPATVSFRWKVDSEPGFDLLSVSVDGAEPIDAISGDVDWELRQIDVSAGTRTVRWTYTKDANITRGADAGWVDTVRITPLEEAPSPPSADPPADTPPMPPPDPPSQPAAS